MTRTLAPLIMAVFLVAAPLLSGAKASEITRILGGSETRPAITERTLERIVDRADEEYTRMMSGGPATVKLLDDWASLVDYYGRQRDQLPDEKRVLASKEAGTVLYGHKSRWNGFRHAFHMTRLSPDGKSILLYQLSVHHAYMVLRGLGFSSSNAGNPLYWELYNHLIPYTKAEGYMTSRDAQSRAELQAQAAKDDRLRRGLRRKDQDVSAALANVQAARWEFQRALERYASGNPEAGHTLLDHGVRSFMRAFQFGARPHDIEQVLAQFEESFTSTTPLHGEETFRALVGESIDFHLQGVSGRLARDVMLPDIWSFYPADSPVDLIVKGETEIVEVTAERQKLNRDIFSLEQLKTFVKEVSGEPVLQDYRGLVAMAAPAFHGMFFEIVGADEYERLFRFYREERPGLTEGEARRQFVLAGSAVLTNASMRKRLTRSGDIIPVKAQLSSIDSHHLWRKGGSLWAESAGRLLANASATENRPGKLSLLLASLAQWNTASEWYVQAEERLLDEETPSTLYLNIGACAKNRYAISNVARRMLREDGLQSLADMDTFLSRRSFDREQETAVRQLSQPGYAEALGSLIEGSYRAVISRGGGVFPSGSPGLQNRLYAQYVTALAHLGVFREQFHEERTARRLLAKIENKPANGEQFYFRGVIRAQILHDEAGARRDYLKAQQLLKDDPDPEAILTLEKIAGYLHE